ncbi:MAG: Cof-type HAD-IIB family hydrolase [Paenisporosarcina sp.]
MKKTLFFDIDGTLFNSDKKLPRKSKEAIFKAKENGHNVLIATGRAPFMIREILDELKINSYICFNGQYIVYENEVIYDAALDYSALEAVTEFANQKEHPLVYMNAQKMIASLPYHRHVEESMQSLKVPHPFYEEGFYMNEKIYQALVFCSLEEELAYQIEFPNLKFVRWHRVSADILPKGASKAEAIHFLVKKMNFQIENTIAFGDGLNDIEMLEAVGFGVAMGNGHAEAIKRAKYVTKHVDEDGLYEAMRYLKLI